MMWISYSSAIVLDSSILFLLVTALDGTSHALEAWDKLDKWDEYRHFFIGSFVP